MEAKEDISKLWLILVNFEKAVQDVIKEDDYLQYIERVYVYFLGKNQPEIYNSIKGLQQMGLGISHRSLKSIVFHLIDEIKGGGNLGA